ncbi:MAG: hypothetical protein F6K23_23115 [Okeania sp. SIO2C9]|nr:hypothetical protein [Okeania sp. SIO2C9]
MVLTPAEENADDNLPCPYQGLYHFNPENTEYFFGREVFVEELYQYTETRNFVPVLGASGSGKSSVILAGLVPKLVKTGHWQFTHFRPGTDPFYALARALIPLYAPNLNETQLLTQTDDLSEYLKDTKKTNQLSKVFAQIQHNHPHNRTLLIADQFEELYTLCNDEQTRRKFLDTLLHTFRSFTEKSSLSTVLVATMRADFLGNVLSYPPLADVLRNGDVKIRSMNVEELREVIEKPAQKLGVNFESGLVERILEDVDKEPGNLPLLEFALTELWKQRKSQKLTHQAYEEIGQVSGALTRYADDKFSKLKPEEQQQVHRIFVQLVRPGAGTEDTRRVATRAELNQKNWNLVKKLADARLVVTSRTVVSSETENNSGQETVEVVHEALIRNWGQLKEWMENDREFRAWQERLRGAMHQWEEMKRDKGQLLRGVALLQAQEQLKDRRDELSQGEQEFIRKSQKYKQRKRQRMLAGMVAFSVIISLLAVWSEIQRRKAVISELKAEIRGLNIRLVSGQRTLDLQLEALKLEQGANGTTAEIQTTDILQKTFDWQGHKEINRLEGHENSVNGVAFSPQGDLIASASADKTVKLWRPDGTLVRTLTGHENYVNGVAFSPQGDLIASASADKTVKLWRPDGTLVRTLTGHENYVWDVAFSLQGDLIASASDDKTVKLWRPDGTLVRTLTGHENYVYGVAFSPQGDLIASASRDKTVKLWRLDGTLVRTLTGHENYVNGVAFSPQGDLIASASDDKTVKLWRLDGTLLRNIIGHENSVWRVAFSPQGDLIASASDDKTVKLWRPDGTLVRNIIGHENSVWRVAFSPQGDLIASASGDKTVKLWRPDGTLVRNIIGHENSVWRVAFSPQGDLIASASDDKTVKLWRPDGTLVRTLTGHENYVRGVAFSPQGDLIASASDDKTVKLWRPNGTLVRTLIGHENYVYGVAFSPQGDLIASAGYDKTVKLWRPNGTLVRTLTGHKNSVMGVAFSPQGDLIASAGYDKTVKLWRTDGTLVRTLTGHENYVYGVAFSPQGGLIASASRDKTVKLWRPDGTLVRTLTGHENYVRGVAFSPQGDLIASASADKTVKLWRPDGTLVRNITGHENSVRGVAFSPKGDLIASASADKTVKLWNFNRDDLIAHACQWMSDYLKNNPNVTEEERRLCGVEASATALFLQGEKLAAEGEINEAISAFQKAVKLDSDFSLNSAASLLRSGRKLIENQKFDEAISAYNQVKKLDLSLEISASDWDNLCRQGSLNKQAKKVMFACENAVELEPDNEWIRDSRGLARALTGDFQGAIEDFEMFIESIDNKSYENAKARRQSWVDTLKKGENPLTTEELEKLR